MNQKLQSHKIVYERKHLDPIPYAEALEYVKNVISSKHANELADVVDQEASQQLVKALISRCIFAHSLCIQGMSSHEELIEKLYNDMAGFAFLTKYIADDTVEEINGNAWDDIEIVTACGYRKLQEHFVSPKHCIDIVRKMAKAGGMIIDGSQPIVDSYIEKGVRISAMIPPVIDSDCGAVFSIRKQKNVLFTKEQLLGTETASEEELAFLSLCLRGGISVAIAGATGSGKTADVAYLLNQVPKEYRVYSIEDSRELKLMQRNAAGKVKNRVIQTQTRETVSANALLKKALRFDPDIIVPAEMRGEEAMTAQEAGRTGHTILTTLHASNAFGAYTRILTMCMQSGTVLSETMMMNLILEAFPIMAFKKQLADKSRKYMKIIEAEAFTNGKIQGRTLYRFVVTGRQEQGGRIRKITGYHKKEQCISRSLALRLLENGVGLEEISKFAEPEWVAEYE